jgi:hypothetical protein
VADYTFRRPPDISQQMSSRFARQGADVLAIGGVEPGLPISPGLDAYGRSLRVRAGFRRPDNIQSRASLFPFYSFTPVALGVVGNPPTVDAAPWSWQQQRAAFRPSQDGYYDWQGYRRGADVTGTDGLEPGLPISPCLDAYNRWQDQRAGFPRPYNAQPWQHPWRGADDIGTDGTEPTIPLSPGFDTFGELVRQRAGFPRPYTTQPWSEQWPTYAFLPAAIPTVGDLPTVDYAPWSWQQQRAGFPRPYNIQSWQHPWRGADNVGTDGVEPTIPISPSLETFNELVRQRATFTPPYNIQPWQHAWRQADNVGTDQSDIPVSPYDSYSGPVRQRAVFPQPSRLPGQLASSAPTSPAGPDSPADEYFLTAMMARATMRAPLHTAFGHQGTLRLNPGIYPPSVDPPDNRYGRWLTDRVSFPQPVHAGFRTRLPSDAGDRTPPTLPPLTYPFATASTTATGRTANYPGPRGTAPTTATSRTDPT